VIRVLIADDHPIFRKGLAELLAGDPSIEVAGMASDGEEALSLARSLAPDLLVLDISMPKLDGFAVAGRLREEGAVARVVMLSMHKDPASVRRAFALGVGGFVLKEEAFSDLMYAISAVARGQRFFSPAVQGFLGEEGKGGGGGGLTPREREVAELIALGRSTKEIASELAISGKTVETHRQHIMEKLGCRKATEIAAYAVKAGWVR
jgi:DNA-binding NarL/FixJ family response regulator